jgi:hypothetical protein
MDYNKINPKAIGNPDMVGQVMGMGTVNNAYGNPVNNLASQVKNTYGQQAGFMGQQDSSGNLFDGIAKTDNVNMSNNDIAVSTNPSLAKLAGTNQPSNTGTITTPLKKNNK